MNTIFIYSFNNKNERYEAVILNPTYENESHCSNNILAGRKLSPELLRA